MGIFSKIVGGIKKGVNYIKDKKLISGGAKFISKLGIKHPVIDKIGQTAKKVGFRRGGRIAAFRRGGTVIQSRRVGGRIRRRLGK